MINDLKVKCQTTKYVDDTTVANITSDPEDTTLQDATNNAISWSRTNDMNINASKTKEMLVSFATIHPKVPAIMIDNAAIERVHVCTLLGVDINDNLKWDSHVEKIFRKAY